MRSRVQTRVVSHRHPAIDGDDLAGDIAGGWRSQVEDQAGNFLAVAKRTEGDPAEDFVLNGLGETGRHIGINKTGGYRVTGHIAAGEFTRDGFGEAKKTRREDARI